MSNDETRLTVSITLMNDPASDFPVDAPPEEGALSASSEERYQAFVHNSSEGIWCFELDRPLSIDLSEDELIDDFYAHGFLSECNDAFARTYGFEKAEEIIGARLDDITPRSDPQNVEYLRTFIRSGYRLVGALSHELDREGNPRFIRNNLFAIKSGRYLLRAWGTQTDVTEQRRMEEAIQVRLRYEQALSACSQTLLVKADPAKALPEVLSILRDACEVDRVYLFENFLRPDEKELCSRQIQEVCADGVTSTLSDELLQQVPYSAIPRWRDAFEKRQPIAGTIASFPLEEQELLVSQGIQSLLALPIHIGPDWYGFIGFDDVSTPRHWQETDIRLLQTVAEMIGAYLGRLRAENALREAQRRAGVFVREVLASVTGGRLFLCGTPEDLPPQFGDREGPFDLTPQTLKRFRSAVRSMALSIGFSEVRIDELLTGTGEAAMNAVVHARNGVAFVGGSLALGRVQVRIEDLGGGIDVERIPRATLERGYSSAGTLGHGFWLMLQTVDRVYLLTSPQGTTVVLEQDQTPPEEPVWLRGKDADLMHT